MRKSLLLCPNTLALAALAAFTLGGCSVLPLSSMNLPQTLESARTSFPDDKLAYFYFNETDYRTTATQLCKLTKVGAYRYTAYIPVPATDTVVPVLRDNSFVAVAPLSWAKTERNPHCLVNSNQRESGWHAGWINTTPLDDTPTSHDQPRRVGHPFAPMF